jgi:hypothetical protein
MAAAVGLDLGRSEFGHVGADVAVRGQAIAAAIQFGDGERDPFTGRRRKGAPGQSAGEGEKPLQGGRAVRDEAEQVRHTAQLLFDRLQQRLAGGGGIGDGGGDG